MTHAIRLPLEDLDESPKPYRFALDAAWVGRALADTGIRPSVGAADGELRLTAQLSGRDVLVQGQVHVVVATDCARCLEDAAFPVDVDLATVFVPVDTVAAKRPAAGKGSDAADAKASGKAAAKTDKSARGAHGDHDDDDLTEDDGGVDTYSGEHVELDGLVRELIVLEEPMQPLCRPDCPGIPIPEGVRPPADFGREGDVVDPRLSPLMKLKRAMAQTEE